MSKAKQKGYVAEKWVEGQHWANEIPCERVMGSGMFGGKYSDDLVIPNVETAMFRCEVKKRKDGKGFAVLEKWMGTTDIMFLKRNNQPPLVVLTMNTYLVLMKKFFEEWRNNGGKIKP